MTLVPDPLTDGLTPYRLTIIIAEEHAAGNLAPIFEILQPGQHPDVEYIVCSSTQNGAGARLPEEDNVHLLPGRGRIPLLWRNGILAAQGDRVALTTAHCIPDAGWVERLLQFRLDGNLVGVGGALDNAPDSDTLGWAIYLLRYFGFRPAREAADVAEIAADNALYRNREIRLHGDLLEAGFWEPSFHQRFRQAGLVLRFDPGLVVMHHNRYSTWQFLRQRLDHGIAFGRARAADMPRNALLVRLVLSPAIPVVFLAKILGEVLPHRSYRIRTLKCLPLMFLFVCGWSLGEAMGYLQAMSSRSRL